MEDNLQPSAFSPQPSAALEFRVGIAVRMIGGKFNGFQGTLAKMSETVGSVRINFEGRDHEVVVDLCHVQALAAWQATKSATELSLRGAS